MTARDETLGRFRTGSVRTYRQRAEKARAWVARARRDDLDGWQAALGSWARLALLAAAGYGAFQACRSWPWLMWPAAAWWLITAWRAGAPQDGKEKAVEGDEEPEPDPEGISAAEFAAHVRAAAGPASGAQLAVLAEHLTEVTGGPWSAADVRALCTVLDVPIASVRMPGRGVSTGVRLKDLPEASSDPSQGSAVAVVVAGQDTATEAATPTATGPATAEVRAVGGVRMTLVDDPDNPVRTHVTVHP